LAEDPPPTQHPTADEEPPTGATTVAGEDAATDRSVPSAFGLSRYQGYLLATVEGRRVPELLDVLAEGEQAVEAGFVARLDGDAHGYCFFFDARLGARPAETLAAAFRASGIDVALGVIADVRSLDDLVRDAHAAGLLVHPYTFRNENSFLPLELRRGTVPAEWGNAIAEYEQFFALGVDGVFSDYPDTAVDARDGAVD